MNYYVSQAIQLLQSHGFRITLPQEDHGDWETPGEFRARLAIHPSRLSRALVAPGCPLPTMQRTATGRILRLRSHPEFEAFVRTYSAKKTRS